MLMNISPSTWARISNAVRYYEGIHGGEPIELPTPGQATGLAKTLVKITSGTPDGDGWYDGIFVMKSFDTNYEGDNSSYPLVDVESDFEDAFEPVTGGTDVCKVKGYNDEELEDERIYEVAAFGIKDQYLRCYTQPGVVNAIDYGGTYIADAGPTDKVLLTGETHEVAFGGIDYGLYVLSASIEYQNGVASGGTAEMYHEINVNAITQVSANHQFSELKNHCNLTVVANYPSGATFDWIKIGFLCVSGPVTIKANSLATFAKLS